MDRNQRRELNRYTEEVLSETIKSLRATIKDSEQAVIEAQQKVDGEKELLQALKEVWKSKIDQRTRRKLRIESISHL